MSEEAWSTLQELVNSPENQCFACGPSNPVGLHLHFENVAGEATARFMAGANHGGWAGVVHGGILTTILDEAMAYTLFFRGLMAMTGRLEVRFRRPVIAGMELNVRARILTESKRFADVEAMIEHQGTPLAEAKGRFMKVGPIDGTVIAREPDRVR